MAATAANADEIEISDRDATLTWFHPIEEAAYAFCSRCGSSLFWRSSAAPGRISICAGTLDPPTGLKTVQAWWVKEASDYHQRPDLLEFATE